LADAPHAWPSSRVYAWLQLSDQLSARFKDKSM